VRADPPEAAACRSRQPGGGEQVGGVAAPLPPKEVGRRRTLPHELQADVAAAPEDISQEPSVPVSRVELRIANESDVSAGWGEPTQGRQRGLAVAVTVQLRRVDLYESHSPAVRRAQRVAVIDVPDDRLLDRRGLARGRLVGASPCAPGGKHPEPDDNRGNVARPRATI
jgi:hypothetical protein